MKYFLILFLLITATTVNAQTQTQQAPPCSTPEHRQFDFWIGEWAVDQGGKPAGTNKIELILNRCVIQENWTGSGGFTGKSFNEYNEQSKQWQQFWVDNSGSGIFFTGNFQDGKMHLRSEGKTADGKQVMTRMIYTPMGKDRLRQLWERSDDDGKTWQTIFDGNYVRKK
jgi:hypothetical protein